MTTKTNKKLKKRKLRKRTQNTGYKEQQDKNVFDEEAMKITTKHVEYEYNSDFEDFEDDSSNDEGFASGQATAMSGAMSPVGMGGGSFAPRLATMQEEEEELSEADIIQETNNEYDISFNNDVKQGNNLTNLASEEMENDENSWNIFLQPHVSKSNQKLFFVIYSMLSNILLSGGKLGSKNYFSILARNNGRRIKIS